MSDLAPCPACQRHVRVVEATCPFCASALADAERRAAGTTRLTRAAVFAGAALAAATAGCGGKQSAASHQEIANHATGGETIDAGATPDAPPVEVDHSCCMPYGAPPVRERLV